MDAGSFEVFVAKEDFKFHCAHFVTFAGFRERLHGHNYRVSVCLKGNQALGHDGYVVDFGDIKKTTRKLCKALNEHFICPCHSDVMNVSETEAGQVELTCEDGSFFSIPRGDCAMLPLVHSTAEELARYLWCELAGEFGVAWLRARNVERMEVTVSEAAAQQAVFRCAVPADAAALEGMKRSLYEDPLPPRPCRECEDDEGEDFRL